MDWPTSTLRSGRADLGRGRADHGGLVGVDRDGDLRRLGDGVAGDVVEPVEHLELAHDDVAGELDVAGVLAADHDGETAAGAGEVLLGDGDLEAVLGDGRQGQLDVLAGLGQVDVVSAGGRS